MMNLDFTSISFLNILTVTAICLVLDAVIVSQLSGPYRLERSHYILSLLSAVVYVVACFWGPLVYRNVWVTVMIGLYVFDVAVIVREWPNLKRSYRNFYTVHHLVSFLIFGLWAMTFKVFTLAMAIGSVIWITSDVYRWADQVSRLGGRFTPPWVDRVIFWLERSQRIIANFVGFYLVGFVPQFIEEIVFAGCAFVMDIIDTWFQIRASSARKAAAAIITKLCKNAPLFSKIDSARLDKLAELMSTRSYAAGEIIVSQGEKGESMFVVLAGTASVYLEDGTVLGQLVAGDIGGEMSLLSGKPRNASVRAETAVRIGVVTRDKFLSLIATDPILYDAVWRSYAERTFNRHMLNQPKWGQLDQSMRLAWIQSGKFLPPIVAEEALSTEGAFLFVITGTIEHEGQRIRAPAFIPVTPDQVYHGSAVESLIMLLPDLPVSY